MKIASSTLLLHFIALLLAGGSVPPRFIVHSVDETLPPAPLAQIANDFSLKTAGAQPKQVSGKDLVAMRQVDKALPLFLSHNVLLLNNGDHMPFDPVAGLRLDQDRLYFRPGPPLQSAKELDLSLNYIAALCFGQVDASALENQNQLLMRLLSESRSRDVILFADGDRVEGTLKGLNAAKGATFDLGRQEVVIAPARIKAIAFNTEFKARPRTKGSFAQAVLAGGGRVGFSRLVLETGKEKLTAVTLFGATVEMGLADLLALDIRQGPAIYLSDLSCKFEHTPFLGVSWPLVKDAGVSGRPLQLGQDFFEKGLGMHSQSRATYRLDGKYRWFEAVVGLDERLGQMGRVRLRVLIDGKERNLLTGPEAAKKDGASLLRTRQDGPLALRLDVRGAKELTLAVDVADFGDVQGHVNWVNARLIQ